MPSLKRNWCAHPRHLETSPDGKKMFTKFGPKPSHPIGSRRITPVLRNYINRTCMAILKDPSLKLNANHSLCTKCYQQELKLFEATDDDELCVGIQKVGIDEHSNDIGIQECIENSPNLVEVTRDYYIEKLNKVFEMFQLGPVVP